MSSQRTSLWIVRLRHDTFTLVAIIAFLTLLPAVVIVSILPAQTYFEILSFLQSHRGVFAVICGLPFFFLAWASMQRILSGARLESATEKAVKASEAELAETRKSVKSLKLDLELLTEKSIHQQDEHRENLRITQEQAAEAARREIHQIQTQTNAETAQTSLAANKLLIKSTEIVTRLITMSECAEHLLLQAVYKLKDYDTEIEVSESEFKTVLLSANSLAEIIHIANISLPETPDVTVPDIEEFYTKLIRHLRVQQPNEAAKKIYMTLTRSLEPVDTTAAQFEIQRRIEEGHEIRRVLQTFQAIRLEDIKALENEKTYIATPTPLVIMKDSDFDKADVVVPVKQTSAVKATFEVPEIQIPDDEDESDLDSAYEDFSEIAIPETPQDEEHIEAPSKIVDIQAFEASLAEDTKLASEFDDEDPDNFDPDAFDPNEFEAPMIEETVEQEVNVMDVPKTPKKLSSSKPKSLSSNSKSVRRRRRE